MKQVSSIQVICTTVVSAAFHISLFVLSNDNRPPVAPIPFKDVIHVALTEIDTNPDPVEEITEPNRPSALNDTLPNILHQAQNLIEPPRPPQALLTQEPVTEELSKHIVDNTKINKPKVLQNLETLTALKVVELSSEEMIKDLKLPDEPPPKPVPPILPTHGVPLQVSEIEHGIRKEVILPKAHVSEPTPTLPVQSEPLISMLQETLDTQTISENQKVTDPVKPIQTADLAEPMRPTKPAQLSNLSETTENTNNVDPTPVEERELALKPLESAPQIIDQSRQNLARLAPISENTSDDGLQKREEQEAIAHYVTLLHKAISNRARRDYPSRAIKRREEGRVLAEIKVGSDGKLLEIKISNESTASDTLIRAAERAIKKEAPFAQFAEVVNKEARWFRLSLNYQIQSGPQ